MKQAEIDLALFHKRIRAENLKKTQQRYMDQARYMRALNATVDYRDAALERARLVDFSSRLPPQLQRDFTKRILDLETRIKATQAQRHATNPL